VSGYAELEHHLLATWPHVSEVVEGYRAIGYEMEG